jgi:transaldolase/glucose-6-phosphate isomerase
MSDNPPVDVQAFGQSIWYDNIRRSLIGSGDLQKLIDEFGVVGVTSNPAIFQKAIGESDDYDASIADMLDLDAQTIYERLAIDDIQHALDLFRPIYDRTEGRDGFVSMEVSPLLANDTAGTIAEARRLFETVNRPNLMVKIPATKAGIPAIEECIAAGVNINVTLLFSVKNYEEVAEAYVCGLERRQADGQDVRHVASVASFFVSRIDTLVDHMLENNIRAAQARDLSKVAANSRLLGKTAIANAKLAYRHFQQLFYGERFAKLREAGARVQRPLWASTGTKNPAYADTMYLDNLIGADTVNTVPPATLKAFKDHGKVGETLTDNPHDAEEVLRLLPQAGVDIDQVTQQLQDDGVEAFVEAFKELLNQVEAKRTILKTGVMAQQKVALGIDAEAVQHAIRMCQSEFVNARLWARDGTLWKTSGPLITAIKKRMGWLDVRTTIDRARLQALQNSVRDSAWKHALLLGMGGSSLAPEVLSLTFGKQPGFPELLILDSTDPVRIREVEQHIDLQHTLFIVASKSGETLETEQFHKYFYELSGKQGSQFIAITDEGSELETLAKQQGFRDLFLNPSDIGGRYSALSYFGMVPAALMGLDLNALWENAERMMLACGSNIPAQHHPGIWLGVVMGALGLAGRNKVSIHCSRSIASFGSWIEQLIAESLGKENRELVPIVGATVGKPHDYVSDRVFIYLKIEGDEDVEELDSAIRVLREAGHPRATLTLADKYALAGEFFRWEYATAVAGKMLGVNPFDEPNVTESKQNTARMLDIYKAQRQLPSAALVLSEGAVSLYADDGTLAPLRELCAQHGYNSNSLTELLAAQLVGTHAGEYFALLAYLPPTAEVDAALQQAQRRLRHVTKRAVTVGYGPRYLHSTGQLHKGGGNHVVVFQLTYDDPFDIAIPGEEYGFSIFKAAQAAGDLEAMRAHDRRAVRLHSAGETLAGIRALLAAIDHAEMRRQ